MSGERNGFPRLPDDALTLRSHSETDSETARSAALIRSTVTHSKQILPDELFFVKDSVKENSPSSVSAVFIPGGLCA